MDRALWDVEEGHLTETKMQRSGQGGISRGSAIWVELQNVFRHYQGLEGGEAQGGLSRQRDQQKQGAEG